MCLPPLGYRADPGEIVAFFAGPSPTAAFRSWPTTTPRHRASTWRLELVLRLYDEVDGVVAIKECSGDARRIPRSSTRRSARGAGRRRRLGARGLRCRRDRLGDRRRRRRAARGRRALRPDPAGRPGAGAGVYRRLLPLARFDMTPKLVQYFKAAQDAVGLAGGPTRPPRLPLTEPPTRAAICMSALTVLQIAPHSRVRAARSFAARRLPHRGDADARRHRRRRADPGRDDARAQAPLRGRAGRAAAAADARAARARAMSGAILQPPARADADWGVMFIEVSGLPADVRARHDRRGHGAGRDRHGRGDRARDGRPPGRPGRARRGARAGRATAARAFGHDPQRPVVPARPRPHGRRPGLGEIAYDMAYGGNFYAITPAADAGLAVDPERSASWSTPAWRLMAAINAADRPRAPRGPAHRRLPPRRLPRAGPRRRGRPRRDLDPPRLARPLAVRHRHRARGWPSCTLAASSRSASRSSTSR